jgi:hypothetical protein
MRITSIRWSSRARVSCPDKVPVSPPWIVETPVGRETNMYIDSLSCPLFHDLIVVVGHDFRHLHVLMMRLHPSPSFLPEFPAGRSVL